MQTVYADVLFLLNLFVNFLILNVTGGIFKTKTSFWRLLLGSSIGAAGSFLIFMPTISPFLTIAINFTLALLIVFSTFGYKHNFPRFLRLFSAFFGVSFVFAGIMLALWLVFEPQGMFFNNGSVYFNISPLVLLCSSVGCYLVLSLVKRIWRTKTANEGYYKLQISLRGETVTVNAFLDTGHELRDMFDDIPVIITSFNSVKPLIPNEALSAFDKRHFGAIPNGLEGWFRLVPYSVIGSKGILPAFRPDNVYIIKNGTTKEAAKCLIAVSDEGFGAKYDALISAELLDCVEKIETVKKQQEEAIKNEENIL